MSKSAKNPREHAENYREEQGEQQPKPPSKVRSEQAWSDLISQRIEEAMAAGAFDNLPGKGKPVNAAPEPFVSADMQMANSLLKNNDLSPAWISERKEILAAIAAFRSQAASAKAAHAEALNNAQDKEKRAQIQATWRVKTERWRQELVNLNRRIEIHNLQQPLSHLEIFKLNLEAELA